MRPVGPASCSGVGQLGKAGDKETGYNEKKVCNRLGGWLYSKQERKPLELMRQASQ